MQTLTNTHARTRHTYICLNNHARTPWYSPRTHTHLNTLHTHMHPYTYTYVCSHIHTYTRAHTCAHMHTHTLHSHTCMHTSMRPHKHIHSITHAHVYACEHTCTPMLNFMSACTRIHHVYPHMHTFEQTLYTHAYEHTET